MLMDALEDLRTVLKALVPDAPFITAKMRLQLPCMASLVKQDVRTNNKGAGLKELLRLSRETGARGHWTRVLAALHELCEVLGLVGRQELRAAVAGLLGKHVPCEAVLGLVGNGPPAELS